MEISISLSQIELIVSSIITPFFITAYYIVKMYINKANPDK